MEKKLAKGFPKKESFFTVLRDAMDIDALKTPALYFGTTTGQLWIGRDGGAGDAVADGAGLGADGAAVHGDAKIVRAVGTGGLQRLHGTAGKTAHRELRRALHEKDDGMAIDFGLDAFHHRHGVFSCVDGLQTVVG